MRKHICAFTVAGLLVCASATASAAERSCAAAKIDGATAQYRQNDDWRALRKAQLPEGPLLISTGPDTRIEVVCSDGIVITIGTSTVADLENLIGDAGPSSNILIRLLEGVIGAVAPRRNWSRFDIHAPLAIASVRSTEWLVSHDQVDGSAVFVREGKVVVAMLPDNRRITLDADDGVDVAKTGGAKPKIWPRHRTARIGDRLGFGWRL